MKKVVYEELRALIAHAQFCEGVKWRRLALLDLHKVALSPLTEAQQSYVNELTLHHAIINSQVPSKQVNIKQLNEYKSTI